MTAARKPTLGRSPVASAHSFFWLFLLFASAACGADAASPVGTPCSPPVPLGCQCVQGVTVCDSANGGAATTTASSGGGPTATTLGGVATTAGGPTTGGTTTPGSGATTGAANAGATTTGSALDAGSPGTSGGTDGGMTGLPGAADAGDGGSQADASSQDAGAGSDAGAQTGGGVGLVAEHGALRVQGNRVVDQHGEPIQLRGMSWFWSQWTEFYVASNVDVMVDDWQASLVRAAMGVENEDGYLVDPQTNTEKVRTLVDRAIERGVYVIIDWHDHHAQDHVGQATAFFEEMVQAYGDQPNVIFEIYNEPVDVSWPVVKAYAEQMIRTIREAGSDNLIIVGTPTWSQDVDIAAADPITSDDNVAYTLHFYANTHKQFLRDKAKTALDRGIALFATEWGTCSADGDGSISEGETQTWLSFLRQNSISWANWALNDKAEACSAVQPGAGSVGPWRDDQLTASGRLVKGAIP